MILTKDKKILIVGLGLIGGSYAEGLTSHGFWVEAITKEDTSIAYALNKGIIKGGKTMVSKDYLDQFDIIVFAL